MLERLQAWWTTRTRREQVHAVVLGLLTVAAVLHQGVFWFYQLWYIEDAAISFAFARNLADGYGAVPTPGGERVEGYSNPTWVFLLTLFELFGVQGFQSAKILGLVFAGLTVPLAYGIAHESTDREDTHVPLYAAAFLAMNAQFAIWGGSGLENSLFNLLLATAMYRTLVELRRGSQGDERFPWSAIAWMLLAMTRPEALGYAAIGGFFTMVCSLADGRGLRPTLRWLAAFWIPFLAYHALRFDYFAWELPNTFYAKIGDHRQLRPFTWNAQGWNYFRGWAKGMGQGLLFPVYILGIVGPHGGRGLAGLSVGFVWALFALLPTDQRLLLPVVLVFTFLFYLAVLQSNGERPKPVLVFTGLGLVAVFTAAAEWLRSTGAQSQIPAPDWTDPMPPLLAFVCAFGIPWLAWGTEGARRRALSWVLLTAGLLYAVYVQGDWMKSWRWMSLVAVPGSVLLALGTEHIALLVERTFQDRSRMGPIALLSAVALVLAPLPANVIGTMNMTRAPETGPYRVKLRVDFKKDLLGRMHWTEPVIDLDVDMGAHMYWTDHRLLDIAGLIDVPFAHHRFDRGFVHEYVFEENPPLLAHLHGGWAGNSRIPTHPEWRKEYVEIPGYWQGNVRHPGNFLRRDAFLPTESPFDGSRSVTFDRDVELVGWEVRSPQVAADRRLYLELGLRTHRRLVDGLRIVAFLSDAGGAHVASFDLPPAYDWVEVKDWRRQEIFHGRFSPRLPEDLPEGTYDLGFVLIDGGGDPIRAAPDYDPRNPERSQLAPRAVLGGVAPWPARVMVGEVRFPRVVEVVSVEAMEQAAEADHQLALSEAAADRCEAAESAWADARAHRPKATDWLAAIEPGVRRALAECHARWATTDPDHAVDHLRRARSWDFEAPAVVLNAAPVAAALDAEGHRAWQEGDLDAAYVAFRDAVRLEPHRAWSRRHAEQVRAERLGISADTKKERAVDWQRRQDELREERAQKRAEENNTL